MEEDRQVIYKIAKGDHYATPAMLNSLDTRPLVFYAKFDSSAIYQGTEDINKLYGFTDANSQVHENSARFGWRWYNNQLEIFAYCYSNGKRSFSKVGTAQLNTWQRYEIKLNLNYTMVFDGNSIQMERGTSGRGVYTILHPYFGGDSPAPHDVFIAIRQ